MGKHTKKREVKKAQDRKLLEAKNAVDPLARAVQERVPLDGSVPMRGPLTLGSAPQTDMDAVTRQYMNNNTAAPHNHPYAGTGHNHGAGDLNGDTGPVSVGNAGGQNHKHSLSSTFFIQHSKEERKRMLKDRLDLRMIAGSPIVSHVERILATNIENLLSLLMDYREMDAFERERRLEDPEWAEWAEEYKRVYGVDEYAEKDRDSFLDYGGVRMDPYEGIAPVED